MKQSESFCDECFSLLKQIPNDSRLGIVCVLSSYTRVYTHAHAQTSCMVAISLVTNLLLVTWNSKKNYLYEASIFH